MTDFVPVRKVTEEGDVFTPVKRVNSPKTSPPANTVPEPPVPAWGRENPNLYGLYGTGKAIYQQAVRPVLEYGSMAVGEIAGTPAGPGGMVAGGTLGYAAGKRVADIGESFINRIGEEPQDNQTMSVVRDLREGATQAMGGQIATKIIPPVAKVIGKVGVQVFGKLTGTGEIAAQEAVKAGTKNALEMNPFKIQSDFDRALRGKLEGSEIVENVRDSLNLLKESRGQAYRTQLKSLEQNQAPIDPTPIRSKVTELMDRYGVKMDPATGKIDLSRVALGKRGARDVQQVIQTLKGWGAKPGDTTATGLDTLKRQLDDFYSESSQARGFVADLKNTVSKTITDAVPEYGKMTKGYSDATKLIKDIESGLMTRKQGMSGRITADQTLRRLMSAMREESGLRKELIEVLGNKSGEDLVGQVAGYSMRNWVPRGIAGSTVPIQAGLAYLVSPKLMPILAASSPRMAAEFLRVFGKASTEFGATTTKAIGTDTGRRLSRPEEKKPEFKEIGGQRRLTRP